MSSYVKPNYTQIPNQLLDEQLAEMGEAELKITLAVCRKTFGWHKDSDRISLSQFQELTGLSRQGAVNGIEAALARGTIQREAHGNSYLYSLVVNVVDQSADEGSQRSRPAASQRSRHTKESIKETEKIKEKKLGRKAPAHMSLDIYREVFRRHVPTIYQKQVIESVGDVEADWHRWGKACKTWLGHGWNPGNIIDLLEYHKNDGWSKPRKNRLNINTNADPEAAELAAAEAKRVAVAKREAARRKQEAK
jgi:phage replication O-like protein O